MIDTLSNLFFRLPRLTILALGFIMLMGVSALTNLPRQEDPTMTERFGSVETWLPGASAKRMESLVTQKIENALREIPEVKTLDSTTRAGVAEILGHDGIGVDQQGDYELELRRDAPRTLVCRRTWPGCL